jgi:hypothetical protein
MLAKDLKPNRMALKRVGLILQMKDPMIGLVVYASEAHTKHGYQR